jgi:hypothetical protein
MKRWDDISPWDLLAVGLSIGAVLGLWVGFLLWVV